MYTKIEKLRSQVDEWSERLACKHKFDMMILWLGGNDVSCQPKYGRRRYTTKEAASATLEYKDIILLYISVSPRVDVSDGSI